MARYGQWKYFYRAVDKAGQTIDLVLHAHRDYAATRHFCERVMDLHGVLEKITIDKSGANTAAIEGAAHYRQQVMSAAQPTVPV